MQPWQLGEGGLTCSCCIGRAAYFDVLLVGAAEADAVLGGCEQVGEGDGSVQDACMSSAPSAQSHNCDTGPIAVMLMEMLSQNASGVACESVRPSEQRKPCCQGVRVLYSVHFLRTWHVGAAVTVLRMMSYSEGSVQPQFSSSKRTLKRLTGIQAGVAGGRGERDPQVGGSVAIDEGCHRGRVHRLGA